MKKRWNAILFPPAWITVLFGLSAFALLIASAITLDSAHAVSILSYAMSFFALILISLRIPDMARVVARFRTENAYYLAYAGDVKIRMRISLCGAVFFGGAYSLFQLCLGFKHHSVWFYAMAGYYALVSGMRLILLRFIFDHAPGENRRAEWSKYQLCGALLMLINLALAVFLAYFIAKIRVFRHHEITTISMAVYSFCALSLAITSTIKYKKYQSPVYMAAKIISLTAASVSMLSLENAMLTSFGETNDVIFHRVILGASGGAIMLMVMSFSVYMMINASKHLRLNHE